MKHFNDLFGKNEYVRDLTIIADMFLQIANDLCMT